MGRFLQNDTSSELGPFTYLSHDSVLSSSVILSYSLMCFFPPQGVLSYSLKHSVLLLRCSFFLPLMFFLPPSGVLFFLRCSFFLHQDLVFSPYLRYSFFLPQVFFLLPSGILSYSFKCTFFLHQVFFHTPSDDFSSSLRWSFLLPQVFFLILSGRWLDMTEILLIGLLSLETAIFFLDTYIIWDSSPIWRQQRP